MRGRGLLVKLGVVLGAGSIFAQPPGYPLPPALPQPPVFPSQAPQTQGPALPQAPSFPRPPVFPPLAPPTQGPAIPPASVFLQPIPPQRPNIPPGQYPIAPGGQPPGALSQLAPVSDVPLAQNPIAMPQEFTLPQKENKHAISTADVNVKRVAGSFQLWVGQKLFREFGDNEANARDAAKVLRDLRPTEWASIGGPKPVVEYGLSNGRPPMPAGIHGEAQVDRRDVFQAGGTSGFLDPVATGAGARQVVPIDLKSVRVEAVRGAWCLRDDFNILFNFGPVKADAEQAAAVVHRYGFNRVGIVGAPTPVMHYLFAGSDANAPPQPQGRFAQLQLQTQVDSLARVGIPVGGVGYVGEMIPFNPQKLAVRKDGYEWVVAAGNDVLGRFGTTEWAARDALRTIKESQFTEFCKVGSGGLTFFLANGKAPTRVPLADQGKHYDLNSLKVRPSGNKWTVTENGRFLLECANAEEGETLIRVLKHYQFDQLCHMGPSPRLGITYLARTGR